MSDENQAPAVPPSDESRPDATGEAVSGPIVVGIGASAGGLAALKTFFEHVREDSGLAFVVVVHLSAEHESHLAELLQLRVRIPVQQVNETTAIVPNRVYVIPPGHNLSAIDTHLRLTKITGPARERAPIDHFFRTLAATHDGHAIGVILTGTGSDGTVGIRDVKAKGGLVIVQDPNEAEYDGMPQSAISTGLADVVLPVAQIPAALERITGIRPQVPRPPEDGEIDDNEQVLLQKIFGLLRMRTGRDYSNYKQSTSLRRIARRMQLNYVEKLPAYVEKLREEPEETQALADDLLITVTNFFRDAEVFQQIGTKVLPRVFEGRGGEDAVRVWSIGCATGEEAYSLAILLLEEAGRHENSPKIQIFATDLHAPSLAKAREGLYSNDIETDVSPARLRRFFVKEKEGYKIRKEVRESVVFSSHNLLSDPPFSRMDLITCRNLLIYLQSKTQNEVIELLHYALNPGGSLVLGPSENLKTTELFQPTVNGQKILQKRNVPVREPHLPVFPWTRRPFADQRMGPMSEKEPVSYAAFHHRLLEKYSAPSILVGPDDKIVHLSEKAGRYLVHPGGELTQNIVKLVRQELRIEMLAALQAARSERQVIRSNAVPVRFNGESSPVILQVRPAMDAGEEGFALVSFDETGQTGVNGKGSAEASPQSANVDAQRRLESELDVIRRRLQSVIDQYETSQEEMRASYEELQSTNEELRSTLEELETSKEELQSVNEELQTVNQENRHKVEELALFSSDLQNLLAATDIATLFLDREFHILRFTPKVSDLFNIRMMDRGRPISDITHKLGYDNLEVDAQAVLNELVPIEREVQDKDGRWYMMQLRPYRSPDERIDGVVVTFLDITGRKDMEAALRNSEDRLAQEMAILGNLHEMSLSAVSARTFENAARVILHTAIKLVGADFGNIQLVEDDDRHLRIVAQEGFDQEFTDRFAKISINDESSCGRAFRSRRRASIADVEIDEPYAPFRAAAAKAGYRAVQSSPLIDSTGKIMGILSTHFRQVRSLSDRDEQMIDLVTREASVLLERLRSEEKLKQLTISLEARVAEGTAAIQEKERRSGR